MTSDMNGYGFDAGSPSGDATGFWIGSDATQDTTDDTTPAIGDIVTLLSGSPAMTVISVCECGTVEVAWYDDYGMNIEVLPVEALVLEDA